MERVTVEQNGERITLEVPDGTTDDQIQEYLTGQSKPKTSTKSDTTKSGAVAPSPGDIQGTGPVAPDMIAPQGYLTGPAGYNLEAIKQTLTPIAEHAKTLGKGYVKSPAQAIIDIGAAHMGFPPPYASAESLRGIRDTYQAGSKALSEGGKIASQGELFQAPSGSVYPETVPLYREVQKLGGKDVSNAMTEAYKKGGNNAVIKYLGSAEVQAAAKADPALAEAIAAYSKAVPTGMAQLGKVVAPVLRTAGKVLGPAGLALNAYEAQEYAKESQLGQRLAQGQGQVAQHQFRNMNVPYGQGFTNQMTPDQATAVLQSGSERDIAAFGGRDRLTELIRLKAAQKVLGPVAPQ